MNRRIFSIALLGALTGEAWAAPTQVRQLDWEALLPPSEREHYNAAPPPPVHDYLGEGSLAALQTGSAEVNRELDGLLVKIPGFVVPLE